MTGSKKVAAPPSPKQLYPLLLKIHKILLIMGSGDFSQEQRIVFDWADSDADILMAWTERTLTECQTEVKRIKSELLQSKADRM